MGGVIDRCINNWMLFLLHITFPYAETDSEVFNITTSSSNNDSCSGAFHNCYTLQEFAISATNPTSHSDNITLELQPGIHHLNLSLMFAESINYDCYDKSQYSCFNTVWSISLIQIQSSTASHSK